MSQHACMQHPHAQLNINIGMLVDIPRHTINHARTQRTCTACVYITHARAQMQNTRNHCCIYLCKPSALREDCCRSCGDCRLPEKQHAYTAYVYITHTRARKCKTHAIMIVFMQTKCIKYTK